MPLNLFKFPSEIITFILGDQTLTQKDLAQCQLVNKELRRISRPFLYQRITLYNHRMTVQLIYSMRRHAGTSLLVKSINMTNLMQEHINNRISVHPRYRILHITKQYNPQCAEAIIYLLYMCERTVVKIEAEKACSFFWGSLLKMLRQGLLPVLKEIPHVYTCYCDCTDDYLDIVAAIGARMNSMSLWRLQSYIGQERFTKKKIDCVLQLPKLMTYPQITTLYINGENFSFLSIYNFGRFIDQYFPSLATLDLELATPPYTFYLEILEFMGLDLDTVKASPKILHFAARNFFYSNLTTLYIMKKFPNLLSLNITSTDKLAPANNDKIIQKRFRGVFTSISPKLMFQYMDYIQSIPSFNVDNFMIPNIVNNVARYIKKTSFSGLVDIEIQEDFCERKFWKVPMRRNSKNEEVLPVHPHRRQHWQTSLAATLTKESVINENKYIKLANRIVERKITPNTHHNRDRDNQDDDEEDIMSNESLSDDAVGEDTVRTPELIRQVELLDDTPPRRLLFHEKHIIQIPEVSFYPRLQLYNNIKDDHFFQVPGKPTMNLKFFMPLKPLEQHDKLFRLKLIQSCIIDYIPFLKITGPAIRHLRLSFTNPKGYPRSGQPNASTSQDIIRRYYFTQALAEYAHLYNGTHLADVLKWCPNLKSITLNDSCLVGKQSFIPGIFTKQHVSLRALNINDCQIPSNALQELSLVLPVLRHLNLSQVEGTFPEDHPSEKYVFHINMPSTSFRTISYYNKQKLDELNNVIYVRIQLEKYKPLYLAGDSLGIQICSEEKYSRRAPNAFTIKIVCKDLRELVIRFSELNYKRFVLK